MSLTPLSIPAASPNRAQIVAREDLVQFINACGACTGQREFYSDSPYAPRVSISFLHQYILGNYRRLYARTLAAGVNDFNKAQIILNLLQTGRETPQTDKAEENALLTRAVQTLPSHRAWGLFAEVRKRSINNRRSRALLRAFLHTRNGERGAFETVKYRGKIRAAVTHAHTKLTGEQGPFLFGEFGKGTDKKRFDTPLFEAYRRAYFSEEAVYELPYTIAEGFATRHQVPRERFLERIAHQMTNHEKLRLQTNADDAGKRGVNLNFDLSRAPLTQLVLYVLSLPISERLDRRDELEAALQASARRTLRLSPLRLQSVATVLDRSYSSSGSEERQRRPLAVALGVHFLLREAVGEYAPFWTGGPVGDPLLVGARGQTNLADGLIAALQTGAQTVIIVSDGCDNDPPGGASEVLRVWRERFDPKRSVSIIHCNPVFSADDYGPLVLSPHIPTVGLRDAEDLATVLGFARFAEGTATLNELEAYLQARVEAFLGD